MHEKKQNCPHSAKIILCLCFFVYFEMFWNDGFPLEQKGFAGATVRSEPSQHFYVDWVPTLAWTESAFSRGPSPLFRCGLVNHATSPKLYRSYYPHWLRELVSPICGIFCNSFFISWRLDLICKTCKVLIDNILV